MKAEGRMQNVECRLESRRYRLDGMLKLLEAIYSPKPRRVLRNGRRVIPVEFGPVESFKIPAVRKSS